MTSPAAPSLPSVEVLDVTGNAQAFPSVSSSLASLYVSSCAPPSLPSFFPELPPPDVTGSPSVSSSRASHIMSSDVSILTSLCTEMPTATGNALALPRASHISSSDTHIGSVFTEEISGPPPPSLAPSPAHVHVSNFDDSDGSLGHESPRSFASELPHEEEFEDEFIDTEQPPQPISNSPPRIFSSECSCAEGIVRLVQAVPSGFARVFAGNNLFKRAVGLQVLVPACPRRCIRMHRLPCMPPPAR